MPSLEGPRVRINSVKSTRKITSAMKMVAASQAAPRPEPGGSGAALCRADGADARRPGRHRRRARPTAPPLLVGTGRTRCICWSSSPPIAAWPVRSTPMSAAPTRNARPPAGGRGQDGEDPRGRPQGARLPAARVRQPDRRRRHLCRQASGSSSPTRRRSAHASRAMLEAGEFDVCTLVYNRFRSVITPGPDRAAADPGADAGGRGARPPAARAMYEYEPDEETILAALLPQQPRDPDLSRPAGKRAPASMARR